MQRLVLVCFAFIVLIPDIAFAQNRETERSGFSRKGDSITVFGQNRTSAHTYIRNDTLVNDLFFRVGIEESYDAVTSTTIFEAKYDTVTFESYVSENDDNPCRHDYWYRIHNKTDQEVMALWENLDIAFVGFNDVVGHQVHLMPGESIEFLIQEEKRSLGLCMDTPTTFTSRIVLYMRGLGLKLPRVKEEDISRISIRFPHENFYFWHLVFSNLAVGYIPQLLAERYKFFTW